MGDRMRPISFSELLNRIFSELRADNSIFGIDVKQFFRDNGCRKTDVFGQSCATPCGPAAGPHTQLAQNIITSYLCGGRFIELKTVQIMDTLDIAKPCIDARDEGYNVEWSTEFTLPKAYDEYLKAWIILHLLQALLNGGKFDKPDFIFNMSVGYNLEGIKSEKMQTFIDSMVDAKLSPKFPQYLGELDAALAGHGLFDDTPFEGMEKKLIGLSGKIDSHICSQLTVSTMHGCPPQEIEAICTYMLCEKHLNTFVKLNPTLLGYDKVREILDSNGFGYVGLRRETFTKDLQYADAVAMLHRLADSAEKEGLGFGVKLTNTLGSVNDKGQLPGDEMYMSGRALFPISVKIAALLSREFNGNLPVSYSGGANAFTVKDLFDCGIRPITLATDMLKPGGYSRMTGMVNILINESDAWGMKKIDVGKIGKLSDSAGTPEYLNKAFRGTDSAKTGTSLPLFDCYVAPCQQACPIHQNIPDYIALVGAGKYADALELIYSENALPNITCTICDHKCQQHCSRMDYEGAVRIREMKRVAVEKGSAEFYANAPEPDEPADVKAAVVGAGPAGLSAAFFLARAGFDTTLFEKEESAGGVVRNIIPDFRISEETVQADIDYIKQQGVKFVFGAKTENETVDALKKAGFDYIFYAVGCGKENGLQLNKNEGKVLGALEFLSICNGNADMHLGNHVVVCGGGNTAMDCARAAKRIAGDVTVVYRRGEAEMPADREEFELALSEGVEFLFLSNPTSLEGGKLECSVMALGEPDASGRRRPAETGEKFTIDCDTLIAATGEKADTALLSALGIPLDENGKAIVDPETNETAIEKVYLAGDVLSGPSTVVNCIASARKAIEAALDKCLDEMAEAADDDDDCCCCDGDEDECTCGHHHGDGHECTCGHNHEDGHECTCGHHHGEGHECTCGHHHDDDDSCCCSGDDDDCCCGEEEEIDDPEERQKLIDAEEAFFSDIRSKKASFRCSISRNPENGEFEKNEAARCLDCPYICNKCVEVCPNRANVAIDVRGCELFTDPFQIVHLDAYCNECGNCASFCNHNGRPYRDKFTLFSRRDDFENSENSGFLVEGGKVLVRLDGKVGEYRIDGDGNILGEIAEEAKALIEIIIADYSYLLGEVEE